MKVKSWQDLAKNRPRIFRSFDGWGLIVKTTSKDGGDACHKSCHFIISNFYSRSLRPSIRDFYQLVIDQLKTKSGLFIRHPDPDKWYSETNRFSRDQLTPLLIAMSLMGDKKELLGIFKKHLKRALLFAWNTRHNWVYLDRGEHFRKHPEVEYRPGWKLPDVTGPEIWAIYIRGFYLVWLYPLLIFCDLFTLGGAIITRLKKKRDDVSNHVAICYLASLIMTTPVMRLAYLVNSERDLSEKLRRYWSTAKDEPPLWIQYFFLLKDIT